MSEFSFTIEHVVGRENELPDTSSRFPDPNEPSPGEPSIERMIPPNLSLITENVKTSVPTLTANYAPRLFEEIALTQQGNPLISRGAICLRECYEHGPSTREEESYLQNHRIDGRNFW